MDASVRLEDSEIEDAFEGQLHMQGFDPVLMIAYLERQRGPDNLIDPRVVRERRCCQPPRYKLKRKIYGRFGHKEARYEFLAMYIYCRWYMKDRSEAGV